MQDDISENDHDLNVNDPIDNNSNLSKDKEKTMSNRNTRKAPTTATLGDSILKNVYGIPFQGLQNLRSTLLQKISLVLK